MTRLRKQEGFGLVELLMAMTVLNVGILAIVAAFNSGIVAINRSSRISTASALADQQMELYRGLPYTSIALDPSTISAVAPYNTDSAYSATQVTATCVPVTAQCNASRVLDGTTTPASPDRKKYRVDTYVVMSTASTVPPTPTGGRPLKI